MGEESTNYIIDENGVKHECSPSFGRQLTPYWYLARYAGLASMKYTRGIASNATCILPAKNLSEAAGTSCVKGMCLSLNQIIIKWFRRKSVKQRKINSPCKSTLLLCGVLLLCLKGGGLSGNFCRCSRNER